ncbi:amino acid permease-associated region [Peptoniphilus sp. ING2-D1G]|nr:amino acid permease-associated region [Peptoniphilus sp. ING2-D1G]
MEKNNERLKKVLGISDMLSLAIGAAIGWAWVVFVGEWILTGGTLGAILGFIIGGIMVMFIGITYAELTTALPKAGGGVIFSLTALGFNWSFVCSWALAFSYLGVVAFEVISFPSVLSYIIPWMDSGLSYEIAGQRIYFSYALVGVAGAVVLTIANYKGIQFVTWIQKALTLGFTVVGVLLLIGAFTHGNVQNTKPLFADGFEGLLKVAVITPFFMIGFDVIPQAAEESKFPPKTFGGLIILSIILSAAWYCLIIFCVSMIMKHDALKSAEFVTAEALTIAWNGHFLAKYVVVIGGMCGILSSWNAFLVAGSRVLLSMGEEGMLPKWFRKVHPKHKTPTNAVLFIGLVSCLAPFLGKQLLTWIANAASFSSVFAYMLVATSFLVLRYKKPEMHRPYRVKHGKVLGIIAIVLSAGMLLLYLPCMPSGLKPVEWIIIGLWVVVGIIMYSFVKFKTKNYAK